MLAIGFSREKIGFNDMAFIIGAHADFRLEDYFFSRTQSPLLSSAKWQSRLKPLHSWSELILYGAGIALGAFVMFSLFK